MSNTLLQRNDQVDGEFNHGAILEKKPVVPTSNGNRFMPFSNLFYWANAWSENGSTIGEHPHQGFEILSFVIKGGIEHYDSSNKKWVPLNEGDVQIIRAGSGISHSEKILPDSQMFQIWFDPNLQKAIHKTASYNDYNSSVFPLAKKNGMTIKTLKGDGSPLEMDTTDVGIFELTFEKGHSQFPINPSKIYSIFVVSGSVSINGVSMNKEDFLKVEKEAQLEMHSSSDVKLFVIETAEAPGYPTYAMMYL